MDYKRIRYKGHDLDYIITNTGIIYKISGDKIVHEVQKYLKDGQLFANLDLGSKKVRPCMVFKIMMELFHNQHKEDDDIIVFLDNNKYNLNINNIKYMKKDEYFNHLKLKLFDHAHDDIFIIKDKKYDDEIWKQMLIDNIPSRYMISNYGRILNPLTGIFLKTDLTEKGRRYPSVNIRSELDGERHMYSVHRLVAIHFVPNPDPENKIYVHHKNDIKSDFKWTNLEWVTNAENVNYGFETGANKCFGENSPHSKLTDDIVHKICQLTEAGVRECVIVDELGVNRSSVRSIRTGGGWKHITSQYDMNKKYKHFLTEDDKQYVLELYKNGKTGPEIAKIIGCGVTTIYSILHNNDIRRVTIDDSYTIKLILSDMKISEISKLTGFTKERIRYLKRKFKNDQI